DRLWPRGVRKADAAIDLWAKDIAPSAALRRWFGHDPARWHEFRRRYSEEIDQHRERLGELRALAQRGRITLVFAAHDEGHNDAVVLREILLGRNITRGPQRTSYDNQFGDVSQWEVTHFIFGQFERDTDPHAPRSFFSPPVR